MRVKFDSNGLEPGTHISNITLDCKNCTGCRSSDKVMQVALTVVAGSEPAAEAIVEPAAARLVNEAQLRLPDVTGTTLSDAQDQLAGLGLQPVTDSMGIERVELITVIAQQPAAGEPVEAGARVILTPGVPVPDLPGLAAGEAQNRLDEVGLLLVTTTGDGTATASQVPAAGAIVAIGTTVTLLLPVLETPAASGAWLAVLALLLAVAGAIFFWRASRRIRAAPAASFDVRSTVDSGSQHVRSDSSEPQRPVIRVRLAGDGGEQSVQGSPASITEKEWR